MLYHSEISDIIIKVFLQNNELLNLLRLGDTLLNGLISVRSFHLPPSTDLNKHVGKILINLRECIFSY